MAGIITLDTITGTNTVRGSSGTIVPAQTGTGSTAVPGTLPLVIYNATGGSVTVDLTAPTGVTVVPSSVKINGGKSAVVNATNTAATAHSITVEPGDAVSTHRTTAILGGSRGARNAGRNRLYIG